MSSIMDGQSKCIQRATACMREYIIMMILVINIEITRNTTTFSTGLVLATETVTI